MEAGCRSSIAGRVRCPSQARTAHDETLEAGSPTETSEAEQKLQQSQDRGGHWREDKIGLLMTMTSQESSKDPCPRIPETFVNPLRIAKLAREIKRGVPTGQDAVAEPPESEGGQEECGEYTPPKVRVKSMVGSRVEAGRFGQILVAAAFARGFFGARRKAFVGDGAETNWTIQQQWFSDFVAIPRFHPRVIVCVFRCDGRSDLPPGMGRVRAMDQPGVARSGGGGD